MSLFLLPMTVNNIIAILRNFFCSSANNFFDHPVWKSKRLNLTAGAEE